MSGIVVLVMTVSLTLTTEAGPRSEQTRQSPRIIQLRLCVPKVSEEDRKLRLLPDPRNLVNRNAESMYEKAVASLPEDLDLRKIASWANISLDQFPLDQAQPLLHRVEPTIRHLEQATQCRECNWVPIVPDEPGTGSRAFKVFAFILAVKAKCHMTKAEFQRAIDTLQTGLAVSRHLTQGSVLLHGLVGIGIGAVMCKQIETFVQQPDTPSLSEALRQLPQPFVDLNELIELEFGYDESDPQLKASEQRVRLLVTRLNRHLAVLCCVEAVRDFAASHGGSLPTSLPHATHKAIPNDPVTQKPFSYTLEGDRATIYGPEPEGGSVKDVLRYELVMAR